MPTEHRIIAFTYRLCYHAHFALKSRHTSNETLITCLHYAPMSVIKGHA